MHDKGVGAGRKRNHYDTLHKVDVLLGCYSL